MKNPIKLSALAILAALAGSFAPAAIAAPVTFWFSGTVDYVYNPSNALPSGVALGTPFSGRVTYDSAWINSSNWNSYASGDTMNAYFTETAGFSMLVQIGGHTITNAPNPSGYNCGYVGVYDQFNNSDSLTIETAHADLIVDGVSTRVGNRLPLMDLYLRDNNKTAYSSASLPATAPTVNQFPTQRVFSWMIRLDDGVNTTVFSIAGEISTLSTNELVTLNLRPVGNQALQLSWPAAVSGFTLQSSTNLATGTWQNVTNAVDDIGMEHTVTASTIGAPRYFRLKK